jgi:exopolysaccharide production protein ExoZ
VHTGRAFPNLPDILKALTESGGYGVQLFFVVSALALLLSWHGRNDGAAPFYVRRFFRIAPMFWLAACVYLAISGMAPRYWAPSGLTAPGIIATFLFLHGWSPYTMNALVPGGWSIAAEVTFYILFPFFAASITSLRAAIVAFLAAVAIAILGGNLAARLLLSTVGEDDYIIHTFLGWWFVAQAPVFLVGFIIYHASRIELPRWAWSLGIQASIVAILFLALVAWLPGPRQVYFASAFGLLALSLGKSAGDSMVNPVVEHIGRVSYSAYFWHFAILDIYYSIGRPIFIAHSSMTQFVAAYVIVVLISIALSTITYRAIEKPMIRFGSRIASRYFLAYEPRADSATRSA